MLSVGTGSTQSSLDESEECAEFEETEEGEERLRRPFERVSEALLRTKRFLEEMSVADSPIRASHFID